MACPSWSRSGFLGEGDGSGRSSLGQLVSVSDPELAEGGGGGLDLDVALTDALAGRPGAASAVPGRCC